MKMLPESNSAESQDQEEGIKKSKKVKSQ